MRYISLFSGIEAASVAWAPLGWEPVAFSEIEPFPCAVLEQRFPDVPNLGDITQINWKEVIDRYGAVDLVVGGSPCQSFSIAGDRSGLAGASGLMFEYIRAIHEIMPVWFLWENVPGALSSEGGRAFAQLLDEMVELGYQLAWRVLDAQFFGVAQRRERLFLVGHLGAGGGAAEILFEPEGVRWDYPSSREKRKELASNLRDRAPQSGGGGSSVLAFAQNDRREVRLFGGSGDHVGALAAQPDFCKGQGASILCIASGQAKAEILEGGVSPTLTTLHEAPILCMGSDAANSSIDEEMTGTLHVGGCSVDSFASNGQTITGPLCARDYKGVGDQFVREGKVVVIKKETDE